MNILKRFGAWATNLKSIKKKKVPHRPMKRSLRKELFFIFLGVLLLVLALSFFVNNEFLEKYYIVNKEKALLTAYTEINDAISTKDVNSDAFQLRLEKICAAGNLSIYAIDSAGQVYLSSTSDEGILRNRLLAHVFGATLSPPSDIDNGTANSSSGDYSNSQNNMLQDTETVLSQTDSYQLVRSTDDRMKTEYLEMWGVLSDGSAFLLRTPLESIRESASIANRFLIYTGIFGIVLGSILIFFFSRRITRPINELALLSDKMAGLDFNARYTSGGKNEIGVLGENFNKMNKSLESAISDLKTANLKLQKDLEQKDKLEEMRTEFLGNVSHELKTPIALIQGYAEGLQDNVNDDPESRNFYCDVIIDEAGKMNKMVKNLLSLNQLEFGEDDTVLSRFNITELISGVIQNCAIIAKQKDITVRFGIDSPLYVWGDEFKIEQVVTNYLNNAINHAGGPRIITIGCRDAGEKLRFYVHNTGDPIPEEDIPRIWEKFYKVDKARTREYGGNGIGLSIVRAVMEAHEQSYGVQNCDDGVEFWFELDRK